MIPKNDYQIKKTSKTKYEFLDQTFYSDITDIIIQSRKRIYSNIDSELVMANWTIGKMIDEKQKSLPRAEYGEKLIEELSIQMTKDFGLGYSERNIFLMRKFYRTFPILQTVSAELSWSHYIVLIAIRDDKAREFYYKEAIQKRLSVRELTRCIHNITYQRYILGNKNPAIIQETLDKAKEEEKHELVVKEPLLFNFLGFKPGHEYYESDLEQAIIDHLQEFLLELGKGYTFVARQKRLDIDGKYFYIDLVLYNIFERCYVLIDLKRGEVTHQDIGQMQMYVNYYTEELMLKDDNYPIGMILCADKNDKVIRYTLGPKNDQIRAYRYITDLTEGDEIKLEAEKYLKLYNEQDE